jgi:hypothetical protein
MDDEGNSKDDVKVPEGKLGQEISDLFEAVRSPSLSFMHPAFASAADLRFLSFRRTLQGKELAITVVAALGEEMALAYKDVTKAD